MQQMEQTKAAKPAEPTKPAKPAQTGQTEQTTKEPLNTRNLFERLHLLISKFRNVDISLLIDFALKRTLPQVKKICKNGIPPGSVAPGLNNDYLKYGTNVLQELSQKCRSCLVLWLKDLAQYYSGVAPRCVLDDLSPPDNTNTPKPFRPRRSRLKRPADVSDLRTTEHSKSPRIACPEFPQSASPTEHRAADLPHPPTTVSGISSLGHNVIATPVKRVPIPNDPFVNTLSGPDLVAERWYGFSYTVDELFEYGVKQDPAPSIQQHDSHSGMDFTTGVKLFIQQDSLSIRGGDTVDWAVLKNEIKQGVGGNEITTFILKPNSFGTGTQLVAKCGKIGILFNSLTMWKALKSKYQRQPRMVGMLGEAQLKLVGMSIVI